MPEPANYENENDWMAACVPTRMDEGDEQDQAVAVCLSMWRKKERDAETEQALSLWQTVKGFFERKAQPEPAQDDNDGIKMGAGAVAAKSQVQHPFMVWKQADGRHRWLAIYSNKFRDEDNPPEILAEAAHKDFVRAVDAGEWSMPELWLWHLPGTKSGAADMVAWDDSGFAVASGLFDEGKENIGKALSLMDDLLTSHGMPVDEIERDTEDPTILTRYRSKEISPLPAEAAANKLTGFLLLSTAEETPMALPKEKRGFLKEAGLDDEQIDSVEAMMADKAKSAEEAGLEFKDQEPAADQEQPEPETPVEADAEPEEEVKAESDSEPEPDADAPAAEAKDADAPAEVASEPAVEPPPDFATREEIAEAFGAHLGPMREQLDSLVEQVQALTKQVSELQQSDEVKMAQMVEETPAASLTEMVGRAIGSEAAKIDGRSSLAKAGPEENEAQSADGPMAVPFLNQILKQNQDYRAQRRS